MKVLLLSNYRPDQQRSMLRYADLLEQGLRTAGIEVETIYPTIFFGRLGAAPTGLGKWIGYLDKYLLFPILLRRRINSLPKNTLVHICDHSNAIYAAQLQKIPHLITCHDLLAIRAANGEFPQQTVSWTGRLQQQWIRSGLQQSAAITSVSQATRDDVHELIGQKAAWSHQIPNALQPAFGSSAPPTSARPQALNSIGRYVLHVGNANWYKNRTAVFAIFNALAATNHELQLVLVGPQLTDSEHDTIVDEAVRQRIHILSNLSDPELYATYKHASLLLFPSFIEGFGWPIIEAQACGCPVATLDRPPMNELNALPSLCIPAFKEDVAWAQAAAKQCQQMLKLSPEAQTTQSNRLQDFTRQFDLHQIAERYIELYRSLIESSNTASEL